MSDAPTRIDPKNLLATELAKPIGKQHKKFIEFLQRVIAENSNPTNANIIPPLKHLLMERYPHTNQIGGSRRRRMRTTRRRKTTSGSNRRKTRSGNR
jgi:hypothetical protein